MLPAGSPTDRTVSRLLVASHENSISLVSSDTVTQPSLRATLHSYAPAGSAVVLKLCVPSRSGACSSDRGQSGCQSPGHPGSRWKPPGITSMVLERLLVT